MKVIYTRAVLSVNGVNGPIVTYSMLTSDGKLLKSLGINLDGTISRVDAKELNIPALEIRDTNNLDYTSVYGKEEHCSELEFLSIWNLAGRLSTPSE